MTTLNLTITANADDNSGTASGLTNATLTITGRHNTAGVYRGFYRFQNVTIPQGSTINSATFSAQAVDTTSTSTYATKLYANAADNPSNPANATALHALSLTTANTTVTTNLSTTNSVRNSFDVTSVVQEIVNRAGFASGNALMILWIDNGSSNNITRRWNDYSNGGSSTGPKLDIDYTEPAPSTLRSLMLTGVGN